MVGCGLEMVCFIWSHPQWEPLIQFLSVSKYLYYSGRVSSCIKGGTSKRMCNQIPVKIERVMAIFVREIRGRFPPCWSHPSPGQRTHPRPARQEPGLDDRLPYFVGGGATIGLAQVSRLRYMNSKVAILNWEFCQSPKLFRVLYFLHPQLFRILYFSDHQFFQTQKDPYWHERAAFQRSAFGRSTAGNDVVATIFVIIFPFFFLIRRNLSS